MDVCGGNEALWIGAFLKIFFLWYVDNAEHLSINVFIRRVVSFTHLVFTILKEMFIGNK